MQAASDPRAWQAETIDVSATWYHQLSERAVQALGLLIRDLDQSSKHLSDIQVTNALRVACRHDADQLRQDLEQGRGFAIVRFAEPMPFPRSDWPLVYWLIGQLLGQPIEQNVQGTLLYDVRDTGQDVRYGARFSVTNAESSFHTDNSFGDEVLDYVGLLCLNTAKSGGLSQIVSGYSVRDRLRSLHADLESQLRESFQFDRRGGLRPSDAPTASFPIFSHCSAGELLIRYLRYWIEVGHTKSECPLTPRQIEAMDRLDQVASDPNLRVEFTLRPGEMLFLNNRWLLHNRTAFEDFAEPEYRRHYVRLWLRRLSIAGRHGICSTGTSQHILHWLTWK